MLCRGNRQWKPTEESESDEQLTENDDQENPCGHGRGTTCVQDGGQGHDDIRQWTERF